MSYIVKEIFATLQGEGAQTGRASIFCRFAGCNLWSGREEDRHKAHCQFCDTDFVGTDGENGGRFSSPHSLAEKINHLWYQNTAHSKNKYVVFTGGEPLLQLDTPLITAIKEKGFEIAVETNGTIIAPQGIDWLCVSPKVGLPLKQKTGSELKLVYPQTALPPEIFERLEFKHFWLQPMDNEERLTNTQHAVTYCKNHPQWRLSLQTHKLIGIP